ncbi:MAG: L-threonylcarbamoyladenylate synthase, partial [Chloroflexi bacterium]|nr:L-threonylcarbamoyladenylate synthase [Chloroflexota bacterium]
MSRNPYRTPLILVDAGNPDPEAIATAAAVLRRGGTVAFPTETVYGLGANALDPEAVERVFAAKGRPSYDPLIVHLASAADLPQVVRSVPEAARLLAAAFWPGPLSLVLPRAAVVPDIVTAGRDTVAVRVPAHPVALALIRAAGVPVAAPSANRFGHTSPTTAAHVLDDLDGRIDLALDGGPAAVGVESTVLDLSGDMPTLLRPGGVTLEQLRAVIGEVATSGNTAIDAHAAAPAPGMLASHYAPRAELRLFAGPRIAVLEALRHEILTEGYVGKKSVGLLVSYEDYRALHEYEVMFKLA